MSPSAVVWTCALWQPPVRGTAAHRTASPAGRARERPAALLRCSGSLLWRLVGSDPLVGCRRDLRRVGHVSSQRLDVTGRVGDLLQQYATEPGTNIERSRLQNIAGLLTSRASSPSRPARSAVRTTIVIPDGRGQVDWEAELVVSAPLVAPRRASTRPMPGRMSPGSTAGQVHFLTGRSSSGRCGSSPWGSRSPCSRRSPRCS